MLQAFAGMLNRLFFLFTSSLSVFFLVGSVSASEIVLSKNYGVYVPFSATSDSGEKKALKFGGTFLLKHKTFGTYLNYFVSGHGHWRYLAAYPSILETSYNERDLTRPAGTSFWIVASGEGKAVGSFVASGDAVILVSHHWPTSSRLNILSSAGYNGVFSNVNFVGRGWSQVSESSPDVSLKIYKKNGKVGDVIKQDDEIYLYQYSPGNQYHRHLGASSENMSDDRYPPEWRYKTQRKTVFFHNLTDKSKPANWDQNFIWQVLVDDRQDFDYQKKTELYGWDWRFQQLFLSWPDTQEMQFTPGPDSLIVKDDFEKSFLDSLENIKAANFDTENMTSSLYAASDLFSAQGVNLKNNQIYASNYSISSIFALRNLVAEHIAKNNIVNFDSDPKFAQYETQMRDCIHNQSTLAHFFKEQISLNLEDVKKLLAEERNQIGVLSSSLDSEDSSVTQAKKRFLGNLDSHSFMIDILNGIKFYLNFFKFSEMFFSSGEEVLFNDVKKIIFEAHEDARFFQNKLTEAFDEHAQAYKEQLNLIFDLLSADPINQSLLDTNLSISQRFQQIVDAKESLLQQANAANANLINEINTVKNTANELIIKLREQNSNILAEKISLDLEMSSFDAEVSSLKAENDRLAEESALLITERDYEYERLENLRLQQESRISGLEDDLDQQLRVFESMSQLLSNGLQLNQSIENALLKTKAEIGELEAVKKDLEVAVSVAEKDSVEINYLKEKLIDNQQSIDQKKRILGESYEAKIVYVSEKKDYLIAQQKSAIGYLQKQDTEARMRLQQFVSQVGLGSLREGDSVVEQIAKIQTSVQGAIYNLKQFHQKEIETQKTLIKQKDVELVRLRAVEVDAEALQANYDRLEEERGSLDEQLNALRGTSSEQAETVDLLQAEKEGLEDSVAILEGEKSDLTQQILALETAATVDTAEIESLKALLDGVTIDLTTSLDDLQIKNKTLNDLLLVSQATVSEKNVMIAKLEDDKKVKDVQIGNLQAGLASAEADSATKQARIEVLEKEKADMHAAMSTKISDLEQANEEFQAVIVNKNKAIAILEQAQADMSSALDAITNGSSDFTGLDGASNLAKLQFIGVVLKNKQEMIASRDASIISLQEQLEIEKSMVERLTDSLAERDVEIAGLDNVVVGLQSRIEVLNEALTAAQEKYDDDMGKNQNIIAAMTTIESGIRTELNAIVLAINNDAGVGAEKVDISAQLDASGNVSAEKLIVVLQEVVKVKDRVIASLRATLVSRKEAYDKTLKEKEEKISFLESQASSDATSSEGLVAGLNADIDKLKSDAAALKIGRDKTEADLNADKTRLAEESVARKTTIDLMSGAINALMTDAVVTEGGDTSEFSQATTNKGRVAAFQNFIKSQMQRLRAELEKEKADRQKEMGDLENQLSGKSVEIDDLENDVANLEYYIAELEAAKGGLTDDQTLNREEIVGLKNEVANKITRINNLQDENEELSQRLQDTELFLSDKQKELDQVKSDLNSIIEDQKQQIFDLVASKAGLESEVEQLKQDLNDERLTVEQREETIRQLAEKQGMLDRELRVAQEKTLALKEDLEIEKRALVAAEQSNVELLAKYELTGGLKAQLEEELGVAKQKITDIETAAGEQAAALKKLSEERRLRIEELESNEVILVEQVDVLSDIVDQHIDFVDLLPEEKERLQAVMEKSGYGNIVQAMISGSYDDLSDEAKSSSRIIWFSQEFSWAVEKEKMLMDRNFFSDGYSSALPDEYKKQVNDLIWLHSFLSKLSIPEGGTLLDAFVDSYQASDEARARATNIMVDDTETLLGQISDKTAVDQKILDLLYSGSGSEIYMELSAWSATVLAEISDDKLAQLNQTDQEKKVVFDLATKLKKTMVNLPQILSGLHADFGTGMAALKIKLNVIFARKEVEMELQKTVHENQVESLDAKILEANVALIEAIKAGKDEVDSVVNTMKNLEAEKQRVIDEQKFLFQILRTGYEEISRQESQVRVDRLKRFTQEESEQLSIRFFEIERIGMDTLVSGLQDALRRNVQDTTSILIQNFSEWVEGFENNSYSFASELRGIFLQVVEVTEKLQALGEGVLVRGEALTDDQNNHIDALEALRKQVRAIILDVSFDFMLTKLQEIPYEDFSLSSVMQNAMEERSLFVQNFDYSFYLLPVGMSYSEDVNGNPIKTHGYEDIVLGYSDQNEKKFWSVSNLGSDGQIFVEKGNRFDSGLVAKVISLGNNLVSVQRGNKALTLILDKNISLADYKAAISTGVDGATTQDLDLSDVKITEFPVYKVVFDDIGLNGLTSMQRFYVEGVYENPYAEAVIIRTAHSTDDFVNDQGGYLTVKTNDQGEDYLSYWPWVSYDHHNQPGMRETFFSVHRFEVEGSVEKIFTDYATAVDGLDDVVIVDNVNGLTERDQALQEVLESLGAMLPDVYDNSDKLGELVSGLNDFVQLQIEQGSLTKKDAEQIVIFSNEKIKSFMFAYGDETNLPKKSPGYVALFGKTNLAGEKVFEGLLDQAEFVAPLKLTDGDYLALKLDGKYLVESSTDKDVIFSGENRFDPAVNFVVEANAAKDAYKLVSVDGVKKLAVSEKTLQLISYDDVGTTEFFSVSGTAEELFLQVPGRGEIVVREAGDGSFSLIYESDADSSILQADLGKESSFVAALVAMRGASEMSDGTTLSTLVSEAMNNDQSASVEIIAQLKRYLSENVDSANMDDWSLAIQNLVEELGSREKTDYFDPIVAEELSSGVSLFAIKEDQQSFFLRSASGQLLRVGDGSDLGGTLKYFPLILSEAGIAHRSRNVFKFVPSSAIEDAYEIIGYSVDGAGGRTLEVRNNKLGFYETSMFEVDGTVSTGENQLFKISGTQGTIKVTSLAGESLPEPFVGKLTIESVDSLNQGLLFSYPMDAPAVFYDALYGLYFDISLPDSDRTQTFEKYLRSFENIVLEQDANGEVKIRDEVLAVVTDYDTGTMGIKDAIEFIREDFTYGPRNKNGFRFSSKTEGMLERLILLSDIDADMLENTLENREAIFAPEGVSLAAYIDKNQRVDDGEAVLREYVRRASSFAVNQELGFVRDFGYELEGWDALALRGDLTEDQRNEMADAFNMVILRELVDEISQKGLTAVIESIYDKVMVPAKDYVYKDMTVGDRLELAENMIYGRYKYFDGSDVFEINLGEAERVVNSIVDGDIAGLSNAQDMRDWKADLQRYIEIVIKMNDNDYKRYGIASVAVRKRILAGLVRQQITKSSTLSTAFGSETQSSDKKPSTAYTFIQEG